ncbi:fasciclin domain-containing protein [Pedobacter sp. MC2016-05]|uniref:fasciclin domain-containing protein n=1 Tax=Pedobacter sp. MC2016-05 TaxID=2994474 RepID=UPI0022475F58|nr:fasciclin domain-containing protein [Pedobacter sp. MC2016-05]MCX2473760.1 fasciclin domain-containing protein [Pedobacter sp. MC2016-05]
MKKFLYIAVVLITTLTSCKKYYFDTGIHDPKYIGTTLQYLQEKKPLFDTTLTVIKLAEMESVLSNPNDPYTFFAPMSGSIRNAIYRLNRSLETSGKDTVSQLSQIDKSVWRNNLSLYIFKGANLLKDYPQRDTISFQAFPGQGYNSYSNRVMNIGVIFNDAGGVTYAGYRQLFLAYIPDLSNPQVALANAPVATSDIQTNTGVIHVLRKNKHNFGFNTTRFIDEVIAAGIKPPTP